MTLDEVTKAVESSVSVVAEARKENMSHLKDTATPPMSFCFDRCDKPLKIQLNPSPVHGIGIFTTQQTSEREIIFAESPALFHTRAYAKFSESSVAEALGWISATERAAFDSLYTQTTDGHNPIQSRFMANAFDLSVPQGNVCKALFLVAARLNHSPQPNAKVYWSEVKGQLVARAIGYIAEGEEVTIAYCCLKRSSTPPRDTVFPCSCKICSVVANGEDKKEGCLCEICRAKDKLESDTGHEGLPEDGIATQTKITALMKEISATQTEIGCSEHNANNAKENSLTVKADTNYLDCEEYPSSLGHPLIPIFGRKAYGDDDYEDIEDMFYSEDEEDVDDLANIDIRPGVHSWLE